jgi:hypothetical protein
MLAGHTDFRSYLSTIKPDLLKVINELSIYYINAFRDTVEIQHERLPPKVVGQPQFAVIKD